jgi:enediyne biosynthesis protein E11
VSTSTSTVFEDFLAESEEIESMVANLDEAGWNTDTPAVGWTITHQIAHIAFTAAFAELAVTDEAAVKELAAVAQEDYQGAIDASLIMYLAMPTSELLAEWRARREAATALLTALPAESTVPWLVDRLQPSVLAAAGLAELFAHGQDIADGLGVVREYTDRIGHVAWYGTYMRDFAYVSHDLTPPPEKFRFELTGPSGVQWNFGPADATQRVTGTAVDFCLLVSRRRHRDDTALTATGEEANRWLDIAQIYRGPAGAGRQSGQFAGASA